MKLNYYLFKQNTTQFEELYIASKVTPDKGYNELDPVENNNCDFEFKVFIQKNKSKTPTWLSFIENHVNITDSESIINTVNSFIVLLKIDYQGSDFFYAITGGFGFTAINRDQIEPGFGLKVALNSINPENIKTCDVRNVDLNTKQQRVLLSKGSRLENFSLDFEKDLLNIIAGKPTDSNFGTSLNGADSLKLNSKVDFSGLGQKCQELTRIYLEDTYKQNFGFIDNVKYIKSPSLISNLNDQLVQEINNKAVVKISITYPDMIEYQNCENYKLIFRSSEVELDEVELDEVYNFLSASTVNIDDILKNIKVIGFQNGSPVTGSVPLFEFLTFETTYQSKTYILSLKKWFEIDPNYINQVDQSIRQISIINTPNYLPHLIKGEGEGKYIDRITRLHAAETLKLDQINFQIPNSRSKIEICDVYSDKKFICIKKDTRSATLSHLFSQGSISMLLLKDFIEYRQTCCDRINGHFTSQNLDPNNFPYSNHALVYAIATDKAGDIRDILPFFSKVNLLQHYKTIKRLGIEVEICKIDVN